MKLRIFLLSIPISLITLLTNSSMAKAAYFNSANGYSEADLARESSDGNFVETFDATSYVDDDGMTVYGLELKDVVSDEPFDLTSSSQEQSLWNNGEQVEFELSFDGDTLQHKVGDTVVNTVNVEGAEIDFNGMILSAQSTETSRVELTNLAFNDGLSSNINLLSEGGEIDFLKITEIDDNFTLTGTQVYSWTGSESENFDLAYQINVGTFQEPSSDMFYSGNFSILGASIGSITAEVPEPKTISLFSLLLVGMMFNYRRHRN